MARRISSSGMPEAPCSESGAPSRARIASRRAQSRRGGSAIAAVDVPDRDGQAVGARAPDEVERLGGLRQRSRGHGLGDVLVAGDAAQLRLDPGAVRPRQLDGARDESRVLARTASAEPSAMTAPAPPSSAASITARSSQWSSCTQAARLPPARRRDQRGEQQIAARLP